MPTTTPPIRLRQALPAGRFESAQGAVTNVPLLPLVGDLSNAVAAATFAASGSFPIATRRSESSASALLDFVTWLAK